MKSKSAGRVGGLPVESARLQELSSVRLYTDFGGGNGGNNSGGNGSGGRFGPLRPDFDTSKLPGADGGGSDPVSALNRFLPSGHSVRTIKFTEYTKLLDSPTEVIGVTHHQWGEGNLKMNLGGVEYEVPLTDVLHEHVKDWRLRKKK